MQATLGQDRCTEEITSLVLISLLQPRPHHTWVRLLRTVSDSTAPSLASLPSLVHPPLYLIPSPTLPLLILDPPTGTLATRRLPASTAITRWSQSTTSSTTPGSSTLYWSRKVGCTFSGLPGDFAAPRALAFGLRPSFRSFKGALRAVADLREPPQAQMASSLGMALCKCCFHRSFGEADPLAHLAGTLPAGSISTSMISRAVSVRRPVAPMLVTPTSEMKGREDGRSGEIGSPRGRGSQGVLFLSFPRSFRHSCSIISCISSVVHRLLRRD